MSMDLPSIGYIVLPTEVDILKDRIRELEIKQDQLKNALFELARYRIDDAAETIRARRALEVMG